MPTNILDKLISLPSEYVGYIWLILGIGFLFTELCTPGLFFFIAFAIGCFAAAPIAFLGYSLAVQCVVALVVSLISFALLKYFIAAKFTGNGQIHTNISALVGRKGIILDIMNGGHRGYAKISGEIWAAKGQNYTLLKKGMKINVIAIRGNHVIVQEQK